MKIGLSSFWCSQFLFELSKTSSDGTAWENLQDVSVMSAVVVIFDLTGGFSFHCFTTSTLTLPWAIAGSFTPHFVLSAHPIAVWFAITFILTFLGFSFLPRVLRFWVGIFFPTRVFYPTLLRLWLRWGQEHPIQGLPLCLPSQSCLFRLTHGLELFMFELQDHWFINCASEPLSIESKLNYWICFACSKSYEKTIKTLWTRLDILLKTASTSHQSYF